MKRGYERSRGEWFGSSRPDERTIGGKTFKYHRSIDDVTANKKDLAEMKALRKKGLNVRRVQVCEHEEIWVAPKSKKKKK